MLTLLIIFQEIVLYKITDETDVDGTKEVKIMVLFKYSGNFWRTLEMSLINCKTIKIFNETYQ